MEKKTIEIDANEAQVLTQLLDIANKSWWLQVAEPCLHFVKIVQEVFGKEVVKEEVKEELKENKSK